MANQLLVGGVLSAEECRQRVTAADWAAAEGFASATRRAQFLSWRVLLYGYLGRKVTISYLPSGQPVVEEDNIYIGVSHTKGCVAVVVSNAPCAVDVERSDRDVTRISERFFTETELSIAAADSRAAVAIWSARECYYKYAGDSSLSLLTDISVTAVDFGASTIAVSCRGEHCATLRVEQYSDNLVVYLA